MAKMKYTAATGSKQRTIKGRSTGKVVFTVKHTGSKILGKGQVGEDQKLLKNSTMVENNLHAESGPDTVDTSKRIAEVARAVHARAVKVLKPNTVMLYVHCAAHARVFKAAKCQRKSDKISVMEATG
ncbi:hypothetical protein DVH05_028092 [Phytophthora capsici]|nr:hypothetical protein DVH05_028092 [Phytophthora capsici]